MLGNGSTVASHTPVMVSNVSHATAIAAGGEHTCVVYDGGTLACWGNNANGQLGPSASPAPMALVPTEVRGFR
jgi:alpha-tubulin suppressor-like RCC1 family protein